jgi:hypothetical protein
MHVYHSSTSLSSCIIRPAPSPTHRPLASFSHRARQVVGPSSASTRPARPLPSYTPSRPPPLHLPAPDPQGLGGARLSAANQDQVAFFPLSPRVQRPGRTGDILGGAYRRSFIFGYIFEFTTLCAATYRRSVAEFSSLCARSWAAVGIVFNPPPAGTWLPRRSARPGIR